MKVLYSYSMIIESIFFGWWNKKATQESLFIEIE